MKKRILRILLLLIIISYIFYFNGGLEKLLKSPTVQAFGDLIVDFHTVGPIFNLTNMKPGDSETKPIDVTNDGSASRFIAVRGARTGGVGLDPKIETVLNVTIKDGSTALYGPKSMTDFFTDSLSQDGIPLNVINSGGHKTYNFLVEFPTSANNLYQAKSVVADISFGTITSNNVVFNEVYYIDTKKKTRFKYQWIELFNPTQQDIRLKNWTITDNSRTTVIRSDKKIKAGGFALLSDDGTVWKLWNEPKNSLKIKVVKKFGNGLDVDGDHVVLKNSSGIEVDRMSWGNDISGFTPPAAIPKVPLGHSNERQAPGFDTDAASDWVDRNPPTPGN